MKFRRLPVLLVLAWLGLLTACSSTPSSSSSSGALFVTTQGNTRVSPFTIDLSTGDLSTNGNGVATGAVPSAMVLAPSGNAAFVANKDDGSVSSYSVAADGTLSAGSVTNLNHVMVSGNDVTPAPIALAIDASGSLLFVASPGDVAVPGSSTISVLSVSNATLTEVPGSPFATADGAAAVAITPSGTLLYVANQTAGTISGYSIDGSGTLTPLPVPQFAAEAAPSALAVTPDGNFLYVANAGSNNVSGFVICTVISNTCSVDDGSLFELTDSPYPAGLGPVSVAVTPSGKYLYVADRQSNQISQYIISTLTGVLTPNSPATISSGANPVWVAVHPGGDYLYAANIGSASISGYKINRTSGLLGRASAPVSTSGQPSAIGLK